MTTETLGALEVGFMLAGVYHRGLPTPPAERRPHPDNERDQVQEGRQGREMRVQEDARIYSTFGNAWRRDALDAGA